MKVTRCVPGVALVRERTTLRFPFVCETSVSASFSCFHRHTAPKKSAGQRKQRFSFLPKFTGPTLVAVLAVLQWYRLIEEAQGSEATWSTPLRHDDTKGLDAPLTTPKAVLSSAELRKVAACPDGLKDAVWQYFAQRNEDAAS
jgi:hypothetical protein